MSASSLKKKPASQDIDLLWSDQEKINLFGKLNLRSEDLKQRILSLEEQVANLEDAGTEAELLEAEGDEEERVYVSLGEAFVQCPPEQAVQAIEGKLKDAKRELAEYNAKQDALKEEMKQLKAQLYAKFGDAINLEVDP